jgi:hypothetical protein
MAGAGGLRSTEKVKEATGTLKGAGLEVFEDWRIERCGRALVCLNPGLCDLVLTGVRG